MSCGHLEVHYNRKLLQDHEWLHFAERLTSSSLVDSHSLQTPRVLVGCVFAVTRGKSTTFFVVDFRRNNVWFYEPCDVRLAVGSSFADL